MFPYLKSAARTLLVDDDETFIQALSGVLPPWLNALYCLHPSEVDRALALEPERLMREQSLLMALDPSREGPILARALDYLGWIDRKQIFSVLVSDHAMPAETGLSLCGRHRYPGLHRVLLTGAADADLAIKAFNSGAIDHFIPKQTPRLAGSLVAAVDDHHRISVHDRGACLGRFLPKYARELLGRSDVEENLNKLLDDQQVIEYVTVAAPMGLMGLTLDGSTVWIQIEEVASLELLQSMAKESGWGQLEAGRIVAERLLPNVDLASQVDGVVPEYARSVEISDGVLAGVFAVPGGGVR